MELLTFVYKCRRCEALTYGAQGGQSTVEAEIRLMTAIQKPESPFTGRMKVCYCKDGGVGLADLIGAEPEKEKL